jgi:hypothetical protein
MYKEKQDKTKQNWAAASGTGMTADATVAAAVEATKAGVAAAGDATTAEAVGDVTTAGVAVAGDVTTTEVAGDALTAAVAVVVGTPKTGPGTTLPSKANRDPPNLGEDNRKQDGEEDSEEEDIQEGDAEVDQTQAQWITQK